MFKSKTKPGRESHALTPGFVFAEWAGVRTPALHSVYFAGGAIGGRAIAGATVVMFPKKAPPPTGWVRRSLVAKGFPMSFFHVAS